LKFAVLENTQDILKMMWEYVEKIGIPKSNIRTEPVFIMLKTS
jgi:hypothetical protein